MTAATDFYIDLQKVYKEKSNQDFEIFKEIYRSVLSNFGLPFQTPDSTIKTFCENVGVSGLAVTHYRTLEQEFDSPNVEDISSEFFDEESLVSLYIAIRAYEQYHTENLAYATSVDQIKPLAAQLCTALGGESFQEKYLDEM